MYIRTDDENNIKELIIVGGMPETNGYEIDSIDEDIIKDILSYKYIDDEFIKNEEVDVLQENIEKVRTIKIDMMSSICHNNIEQGITINNSHYSLTSNDQIEMIKLESMIKMNSEAPVFYHADGEKCRLYSADEFLAISTAALGWITYNRTYFNLLKSEINEMTNVHEIIKINYGDPLNETNTAILNSIMNNGIDLFEFPIIIDEFDYESIFKSNTNSFDPSILLYQNQDPIESEVITNEEENQISNTD